jgi:hypothetical protein
LLSGTTLTWPRCWCWGWKTTWGGYIPGFSFRTDFGERPRTRMTGGFGTPWAAPEPNQYFFLKLLITFRTCCFYTITSKISWINNIIIETGSSIANTNFVLFKTKIWLLLFFYNYVYR